MKNDSGIVAGHGFTVGSPAEAPNKSKFSRNLVLAAASALIYCAALGLAQPVKAESLRVADISAALLGSDSEKTTQPQQHYTNDEAVSALGAFAQQVGAQTSSPADVKVAANPHSQLDDQTFAALHDFAQRLGTAQSESAKGLPQLAEAGSLMEFLRDKGTAPTADAPRAAPAAKSKTKTARPPADATFVDSKVCSTCHASLVAEFQKTLMGRISLTQKGKFDCQNCHGPGSAHVKAGGGRGVGGIMGFGPTDPRSAEEKNEVCLACHQKGNRTNWAGSVHEERGLACVNCHTVMKDVSRKHNLKTAVEAETCFQCHKDRKAQLFRSSHMPVREGKISCSDCHNPHGSFTEALLKKDSINDTCYTCHAEKRGPFLFEHAPVRENCDNCHDPHGTVQEYSLKIARPRLCFECHSFGHGSTTGPGSVFTMGRSCQNCHTAIHGSNSPAGGALQR